MAGKTSQNGRVKTVPAIVKTAQPVGGCPQWAGPRLTPPRTAAQAKRLLSKLISGFIRGQVEGENARTLAYLISIFVQIIRDSDFEKRLQALEQGAHDDRT